MITTVFQRRASSLLTALLTTTGLLFLAFHYLSFKEEYISDISLKVFYVRQLLNATAFLETSLTALTAWKRVQETAYERTSLQQKLIILTYMRSGSSFTGALFGMHPEVFFVYEPLWYLTYSSHTNKVLKSYLNQTISNITESEDKYQKTGVEIMRNFLNCEFEKLDEGSLTQSHLLRSPTTQNYSSCLNIPWNQNDTYQNKMVPRIPDCIKLLQLSCHPAKVTVLKVIEAKMSQAEALIRSDPKVKVLHLVRDPRGVLSSRRNFGKFDDRDPESYSTDICHSILEDIIVSRMLSQNLPGRILTVRYEDIVKDPISATKQLYMFVGLEITPVLEKRIWEMTYAGLPDDCNICPVRGNSSQTANGWRKGLNFKTVVRIQEKCRTLFAVMGYRSFMTEEELNNFHVPTTFKEYDSRLMKVEVTDVK